MFDAGLLTTFPVQGVTWGHPETTGSAAMDFFLSSELLETEQGHEHYTERLVRMPLLGTYYERPRSGTEAASRPAVIPPNAHLYCCPQSLFKFHPDNDAVFRNILTKDPKGVLVLIEGRVDEWTNRLRTRWKSTMPDVADRVIFLPPLPLPEYLQLLRSSDVVLDPLHFGGGNSSYEALAMNVPVVTLPSEFLRGRITLALYKRMEMLDCVATSADDYVTKAVQIANDRAVRGELVQKIKARAPILFENSDEVRCFEETLLQWAR